MCCEGGRKKLPQPSFTNISALSGPKVWTTKNIEHIPVKYSTCHKWCKTQTCAFSFGPVVSGSSKGIFSRNNIVPCPKHWVMHCAIEKATVFEDWRSVPNVKTCKAVEDVSLMVNGSRLRTNVKQRYTNRHVLNMTNSMYDWKVSNIRCAIEQWGIS